MQKTVNIVVSERIRVPSAALPPMLKKKLTDRLVFINPEYEFRQSRGEWLGLLQEIRAALEARG